MKQRTPLTNTTIVTLRICRTCITNLQPMPSTPPPPQKWGDKKKNPPKQKPPLKTLLKKPSKFSGNVSPTSPQCLQPPPPPKVGGWKTSSTHDEHWSMLTFKRHIFKHMYKTPPEFHFILVGYKDIIYLTLWRRH